MGEEIVEGVCKVERFGDGDVQLHEALAAHGDAGEQQHQPGCEDRKDQSDGEVARGAGQACRHHQEDGGDVPRLARRAAEAHQGEGPRHGDARAHVAVHHENHGGDDDGQHHQGDEKAAGGSALPGEGQGGDAAAEPGKEQAEQVEPHRKAIGQDGIKD